MERVDWMRIGRIWENRNVAGRGKAKGRDKKSQQEEEADGV